MRGDLGVRIDHVQHIPISPAWNAPLAAWLDVLRASHQSPNTIKLRSYQLRRFAATVGLRPEHVTTDALVQYLATDGWSASMRHSVRGALRGFFTWAHRTGRIEADPSVTLPRVSVPPGKPRPAGELAVKRGLKSGDTRVRLMIQLAAVQGLRCCEIAAVHTRDVEEDLIGFSLRVRGKGGKTRVLPLDDSIAAEIRRADAGWLFPGNHGGHLSAAYVSKLVSSALPEGITAHMLRHRFAGMAYQGTGHDIRAVQELLGHSSVATTQIYTPVMPDALRRGVAAAG